MAETSGIITYLEDICNAIKKHIDSLIQKENSDGTDLVKPFNDISNKINFSIGITHLLSEKNYFKTDSTATPKQILDQNLKTFYRDFLFLGTMSTIEYYFFQILIQYPNYKTTKKIQQEGIRNVQISKLIKWASQENIIADYDLWDFIVSARNDIVHYNAIARNTKTSSIHDFPISMVQGNEITGKLRSLISLTRAIEESFYNVVIHL